MKDLNQQTTKGNKMKDFLKDVPKLEDLPKALYNGNKVYVIALIEDTLSAFIYNPGGLSFWVSQRDIHPIPELTHWEASDFHKWFAENGMKDIWVMSKTRGLQNILSIGVDHIEISTESSHCSCTVPFSNIKEISKYGKLESTPCTKPIKTGM